MKILRVIVIVLFLLWVVSIFLGYNFYLLQKEKIRELQGRLDLYAQRLFSYSEEIGNLKNSLRKLNSKITVEMKALESKIVANSLKNEEIFSLVERMRKDIQEWQKNYRNILTEIKQCLEKWQKEIASAVPQEKVELGEISVRKK